jgi:hypothetical protein
LEISELQGAEGNEGNFSNLIFFIVIPIFTRQGEGKNASRLVGSFVKACCLIRQEE